MLCFVEDNKVISTIEKVITEPDKKEKDFHHNSGCHDHEGSHIIKITTLIVPVHLHIFKCFNGQLYRPARCNMEHYWMYGWF